jgi:thiamine-monophosphate kinase
MATDRPDSEEAIIGAYFAPLAKGFPGAFDLKDDCASITPEPGCDLVVTTDAVIEGVHFFSGEAAHAIAWKALAVNVSDLVAKGATPFAYLITLALPNAPEPPWLASFAQGLEDAQQVFGSHLIGGDTDRTPGPLSVSITAFGSVPAGRMVRRSTARAGDLVYVSGTIGDAALGLDQRGLVAPSARSRLATALHMPLPPIALVPVVRDLAAAAIDVSDGLAKDFERLCRESNVGGHIEAQLVPLSQEARGVLTLEETTLERLLTGGEDYQVLAAVRPQHAAEFERRAAAAGGSVTRIGSIEVPDAGVRVIGADGKTMDFSSTGWDHFRAGRRSDPDRSG